MSTGRDADHGVSISDCVPTMPPQVDQPPRFRCRECRASYRYQWSWADDDEQDTSWCFVDKDGAPWCMDCTLKRDFLETRQFAKVVPRSAEPDVPARRDDLDGLKKAIDQRVGFGAMRCVVGPTPWCLVYTDVLAGASFEAHDFAPVCYACLDRLATSTEWPYGRFQVLRVR